MVQVLRATSRYHKLQLIFTIQEPQPFTNMIFYYRVFNFIEDDIISNGSENFTLEQDLMLFGERL